MKDKKLFIFLMRKLLLKEEEMSKKKCIFIFILILVVCASFVKISEGIEVNPTKELIVAAIDYGKTNYKKIFQTEYIAPATFGNWPSFGGGLIKSKLVNIAVLSAMKVRAGKELAEEEAQKIIEKNELTISYRGGADVYKIKLRQGERVIKSKEMVKPKMGSKDPTAHAIFIVASFPYSKIDLNAKTTVIIIKDFGTVRYEVDFSKIK